MATTDTFHVVEVAWPEIISSAALEAARHASTHVPRRLPATQADAASSLVRQLRAITTHCRRSRRTPASDFQPSHARRAMLDDEPMPPSGLRAYTRDGN